MGAKDLSWPPVNALGAENGPVLQTEVRPSAGAGSGATERAGATLEVSGSDRANSFDAIRLLAALGVFSAHHVGMSGHSEPRLPFGEITLANASLFVFFGLSGFLVTQSLQRDSNPLRYGAARALRIYPGYLVSLAMALLVGAALSRLPLGSFLAHDETRSFLHNNPLIVTTPTRLSLPGVLEASPWPNLVTPIWTLKYELLLYAAALAASRLTPRFASSYAPGLLLAASAIAFVGVTGVWSIPPEDRFYAHYNPFNAARFALAFAAGAACALSRATMSRRSAYLWLIPAVGLLISPSLVLVKACAIVLIVVGAVEVGASRLLHSVALRRIGDLSYGVYLYGYPVQNIMTSYVFDRADLARSLPASLIVTLACAALSWHWVERPCLRLKSWVRSAIRSDAPVARGVS